MPVDVILGLQWGDEGKGKIVDYLAEKYQIIARFQGGPNAGHTLKFGGKKHILHTVPSGIFRPNQINFIGNGVVIDPITLQKEIDNLIANDVDFKDRLLVSKKSHLILPTHRMLDAANEVAKGKEKIGSTLKGIGPTYMDKTGRNGLRVGDILSPDFSQKYNALKEKHLKMLEQLPPIDFHLEIEEQKWFESIKSLCELTIVDGEYYLNEALQNGASILAEGAQGSMLDIDFGTYPFVTSSNTITAGVCSGLGIAPQQIGEVIGITKAYCTRVGSGAFPTELLDETGDFLRNEGAEFGSTTGRPRRCGWLDIPQLKYTIMLNGVTQLVVTKTDVLNKFKTINIAYEYAIDGEHTSKVPFDLNNTDIKPVYECLEGWDQSLDNCLTATQLPTQAKNFISYIEEALEVPITMVSIGAEREKLICIK